MNPTSQIVIGYIVAGICFMGTIYGGYLVVKGYDKREKPQIVNVINAKPILDISVNLKKILTLENKGAVDIKDIEVYVTKYIFEEFSLEKPVKIEKFNKIGGRIYNIPVLSTNTQSQEFDLKGNALIEIYDNPGKGSDLPILTFYCLRVSYSDTNTGEQFIDYKVTSSYKDFPSFVDNQEFSATAGGTQMDFMYDIPKVIEKHQKRIFGD